VSVVVDGIELRHVRYFVAVAEEAHFGRAAERLFIAQPSLSYAIKQLEGLLGAVLVDRTDRRHVRLTAAGETFLAHAREVLSTLEVAVSATLAAERGTRRQLRVGYNDGEPLARRPGALGAAVRSLDVDVTFRRLVWGAEGDAVRAGEVDVVLARLPIDSRGLRLEVIHSEPRSICLPIDHPLARRRSLTLSAIRSVPIVRPSGGTREWQDFWRGLPRPDGHVPPDGPVTYGPEDTFDTVATGVAACFVPTSMIATVDSPKLAFVTVTDVAPVSTAIAWSARRARPPGIVAFTDAVRRLVDMAP
jgi:DNA-binding transcriptional LysR family regulator